MASSYSEAKSQWKETLYLEVYPAPEYKYQCQRSIETHWHRLASTYYGLETQSDVQTHKGSSSKETEGDLRESSQRLPRSISPSFEI